MQHVTVRRQCRRDTAEACWGAVCHVRESRAKSGAAVWPHKTGEHGPGAGTALSFTSGNLAGLDLACYQRPSGVAGAAGRSGAAGRDRSAVRPAGTVLFRLPVTCLRGLPQGLVFGPTTI